MRKIKDQAEMDDLVALGIKADKKRIAALEAEVERMTGCLQKANEQAEHFEREWYLRGDEVERLRKDAERYRLLRAGNDYQYDGPMVVLYEKSSDIGERPYWSLAAEALDETIDAALEASR